jgi:hypothetical protein
MQQRGERDSGQLESATTAKRLPSRSRKREK